MKIVARGDDVVFICSSCAEEFDQLPALSVHMSAHMLKLMSDQQSLAEDNLAVNARIATALETIVSWLRPVQQQH
jgi:CRP-like cAMP-binding protein